MVVGAFRSFHVLVTTAGSLPAESSITPENLSIKCEVH